MVIDTEAEDAPTFERGERGGAAVPGAEPSAGAVRGSPGSEYLTQAYADYDGETVSRLYLLVKRTYDLRDGKPAVPSRARVPIFDRDLFTGGGTALEGAVAHESDRHPIKIATDVVVHARAYSPGGQFVPELMVAVEIAGFGKKEIKVIGDRSAIYPEPDERLTAREVRFTAPRPFRQMPLGWDRAYGGWDRLGADARPYPKNPLGMGYVAAVPGRKDGYVVPLPNLEDPKARLDPKRLEVDPVEWARWPDPVGLGWHPRYWLPRAERMGNPDPGIPMETLFPDGLPEGMKIEWKPTDPRYYNGAAPDLAVGPLSGHETITLTNLHRAIPRYVVRLSGDSPAVTWEALDGTARPAKLVLCTVVLDLEAERCWQTWMAKPDIAGLQVPRFMGHIKVRVK